MAKKKAPGKTHTVKLTDGELRDVLNALSDRATAQWDEVREMDDDASDEAAAATFNEHRRLNRLYGKLKPKE